MTEPGNGPAPAYLTADPNAGLRRAQELREALAVEVDAAVRAAVTAACIAHGAYVAPDETQTYSPNAVTVDLPGVGRVDVNVGMPIVRATTPPGWEHPPTVTRGAVLDGFLHTGERGAEVVVTGILGDRPDARPGYVLARISRDGAGRLDPTSVAGRMVVGAAALDGARTRDWVTLP